MESLPKEIVEQVQSFVRTEWIKSCSSYHYMLFLNDHPVYDLLIQWMYFRKREEKARRKLGLIRLELISFDQIRPRYSTFRDVDNHFIRKLELEGEKEHQGKLVQLFHKKSNYLRTKLSKFYHASRLENLFQRFK